MTSMASSVFFHWQLQLILAQHGQHLFQQQVHRPTNRHLGSERFSECDDCALVALLASRAT